MLSDSVQSCLLRGMVYQALPPEFGASWAFYVYKLPERESGRNLYGPPDWVQSDCSGEAVSPGTMTRRLDLPFSETFDLAARRLA